MSSRLPSRGPLSLLFTKQRRTVIPVTIHHNKVTQSVAIMTKTKSGIQIGWRLLQHASQRDIELGTRYQTEDIRRKLSFWWKWIGCSCNGLVAYTIDLVGASQNYGQIEFSPCSTLLLHYSQRGWVISAGWRTSYIYVVALLGLYWNLGLKGGSGR